jgi:hypothetical protein
MPKMPKSVQCRGQYVTALCRVVPAVVTGCPVLKSLTDNICDGVTAENPLEPAAPAFLSWLLMNFIREIPTPNAFALCLGTIENWSLRI